MKKNTFMRLASCLMVAVLLTTCAISGTFAKYTSTATGSDSAKVAKWAINVNGTDMKDGVTFDLFDDSVNYDEDGNEVADGVIAPGTRGSFEIDVENASQVDAQYSLTFTADTGDIPVRFYSDDSYTDAKEITAVSGTYTLADDATLEIGDAEVNHVVYWQWEYERGDDATAKAANNADDTALGTATTAPELEVEATITATQID